MGIAPLFTITISPLLANAFGSSCDPVGLADPTIFWIDPAGVSHRHDLGSDNSELFAFAGTWTEVMADVHVPTRLRVSSRATVPVFEGYPRCSMRTGRHPEAGSRDRR